MRQRVNGREHFRRGNAIQRSKSRVRLYASGCTDRWARTLTQLAREAAKEARNAEIARLAEAAFSTRQIAEETGIPNKTVHDAVVRKRNTSVSAQSTTLYSPGGAGKSTPLPPDLSRRSHVVDLDDEDPDPPVSPLAACRKHAEVGTLGTMTSPTRRQDAASSGVTRQAALPCRLCRASSASCCLPPSRSRPFILFARIGQGVEKKHTGIVTAPDHRSRNREYCGYRWGTKHRVL